MKIQAKGKNAAEILIYEDIGEGWFGGLSAKAFADEIKKLGKLDSIAVRINSYGGSVFDGLAIYNTLLATAARITVHVDGIAASIASVIAMAGDEIRIAENGWMMIHDPWGMAIGDAGEMRRQAELLDGIRESLVDTYATRARIEKTEISALMADETWMNAADALAKGFVTHVSEASRLAAWDSSRAARFRHPPTSETPAAINKATQLRAARMSQLVRRIKP